MAILTIALLILMRTRWGQVQPLSKCVVLSVFAHMLLFLFAYGTRLLEVHTPVGGDDAIQLAFVATDRPPREGEELAEPNSRGRSSCPARRPNRTRPSPSGWRWKEKA